MAKHKSLLPLTFLALFSSFADALLTVPQTEYYNTNTSKTSPPYSTMADNRAPIRVRGRGRAFAARGGRGGPRGGRNAAEIAPQLPRDGGSPIASHLSTLHDASSTTDDTILEFTQVRNAHLAYRNITVRQKHVENVCGGLNNQLRAKNTTRVHTTFTPDSLAEQRRKYSNKKDYNFKTNQHYKLPIHRRPIFNNALTISKHILFNNTFQLINIHYKRPPTLLICTSHIGRTDTHSTELNKSQRPIYKLNLRRHNRNKRLIVNILRQSQNLYAPFTALHNKATSHSRTNKYGNKCNITKRSHAAQKIASTMTQIIIKTLTTTPPNTSSSTTSQIARRNLICPLLFTAKTRLQTLITMHTLLCPYMKRWLSWE